MATNLLSPKKATPSGVPPKNILAFVGLGFLLLVAAGAIYLDTAPSKSQEQAKKISLEEATNSKDVGVKGDPKDITAAADKAGVPAILRSSMPANQTPTRAVDQVPTVGNNPSTGGVQPSPLPLPSGTGTAAVVAAQGSQANLDAVRDTEISNAKAVVVDFGISGSSPEPAVSTTLDPIERLIRSQRDDAAQRASVLTRVADVAQPSTTTGAAQTKTPSARTDSDRAFLNEFSSAKRDRGIYPSPAEAPLLLVQGSSIEAVTVREINSDLPGVITARTTRDIYDSTSVSRLVIPRGTTVIGDYSSDVRGGQARLLFGFTRLVFPDGSSFDLNGFGGSDAQGRSGVEATVDNHYFRLFGTSLLIGLLADRVVRRDVVPQGGNGSGGGLTATGQILTDSARAILERNRESKPTLTIKAGTRVLIEVRRDMIFPTAYRG
jgi:type IV secretory pathway VirB10-like protein